MRPGARTALLVVDMQNGFCSSGGSFVTIAGALHDIDRVVRTVNSTIVRAREFGMPVVFTRHVYQPGYVDAPAVETPAMGLIKAVGGLLSGSWDGELIDELDQRPSDAVVDKCRPDAFFDTSLGSLLRCLGITDVAVAGVVTNICVESTVRSAFMRDYVCTVVCDACTAMSAEDHQASLRLLEKYGLAGGTASAEWTPREAEPTARR
ncbi:MAG: isochorismatase hydrolase [Gemmatimonadales bacterium]|nr:isochorismatase hydrolase [Gemmatimonadales bacterium]